MHFVHRVLYLPGSGPFFSTLDPGDQPWWGSVRGSGRRWRGRSGRVPLLLHRGPNPSASPPDLEQGVVIPQILGRMDEQFVRKVDCSGVTKGACGKQGKRGCVADASDLYGWQDAVPKEPASPVDERGVGVEHVAQGRSRLGALGNHGFDVLDRRIDEMGLNKDDYWWYRDLRRYGTTPHAGFGLGLERTIQYATGMANIRDVIPFPRTPGNAEF